MSAAPTTGIAHTPSMGPSTQNPRGGGTKSPKSQGWAQNQLLRTQGSTHETQGDAGDAPAAPRAEFLQAVPPLPPALLAHAITRRYELPLRAQEVLNGKKLWRRDKTGGGTFLPFTYAGLAAHSALTAVGTPGAGWGRGGAALCCLLMGTAQKRGSYEAGSQQESSTSGTELWGFPSQRQKGAGAGGTPPASTNTALLSGFYFSFTNVLQRNQSVRRKSTVSL